MNRNDFQEIPTPISKRKADVDAPREHPGTTDENTVQTSEEMVVEESPEEKFKTNWKKGKRSNLSSLRPGNKSQGINVDVESFKEKINKSQGGLKKPSCRSSPQSRLQLLLDHSVMHNVILFLNEIDLFQLENAHAKMIGPSPIARQWSYLSHCDENKTIHAHKRWRAVNENDLKAVVHDIESGKIEAAAAFNGDDDVIDSALEITTSGHICKKYLVARQIGRNFAKEAIFVRKRESEASYIYNFDRTPVDQDDVPMFVNDVSLTNNSRSSPPSPSPISSQVSDQGQHWCEWYDYRANSVNDKHAFVRLSLRDGSGRFWHGFRRLKTNYNKTFFRLHFNLKELIKDMRWIELESYLKFNDTSYVSMQKRLHAMEPLMRMTQLTVSLDGKLLVATGGYSPSFGAFAGNGKCYFHHRHYRFPLAGTTKNDLQWMPYRICLADNSVQNELVIQFDCDHADLPFMRAEDIGNPDAVAHW